jgi:hypothetical protein
MSFAHVVAARARKRRLPDRIRADGRKCNPSGIGDEGFAHEKLMSSLARLPGPGWRRRVTLYHGVIITKSRLYRHGLVTPPASLVRVRDL